VDAVPQQALRLAIQAGLMPVTAGLVRRQPLLVMAAAAALGAGGVLG
jgi:hypothetical protein